MELIIKENPYFGHSTIAKHTYRINEGLEKISYDNRTHELVVSFNSCTDILKMHVGQLVSIEILND